MERAVVVGGSIAGLMAARVLTEHASEVIVVERDDLAGGPAARRGVPQGHQVHGLLGRGLERMEVLFPGLTQELHDDGGEVADPGVDCGWYVDGMRKPESAIGSGVACTRPFLEWHLRRRLTALPDVRVVRGRVEALTTSGGRVDGVTVSSDGHEGEQIVRNGVWYIRNVNSQGSADDSFIFGNPGDKPVAADWDGNASATPGVIRDGVWYLRNSNSTGVAHVSFGYGNPTDRPLTWRT